MYPVMNYLRWTREEQALRSETFPNGYNDSACRTGQTLLLAPWHELIGNNSSYVYSLIPHTCNPQNWKKSKSVYWDVTGRESTLWSTMTESFLMTSWFWHLVVSFKGLIVPSLKSTTQTFSPSKRNHNATKCKEKLISYSSKNQYVQCFLFLFKNPQCVVLIWPGSESTYKFLPVDYHYSKIFR